MELLGRFQRLGELLIDVRAINVHWHLADKVGWRTPYYFR